jgi:hypothetical protein
LLLSIVECQSPRLNPRGLSICERTTRRVRGDDESYPARLPAGLKKIDIGAGAMPQLTIGPDGNEDVRRSFQTMYHTKAAADPGLMTPSPAFELEFAKKSVRTVAFILATLPLIACAVLTAKVIF